MQVIGAARQDLKSAHAAPDLRRASGAQDAGARISGTPRFAASMREALRSGKVAPGQTAAAREEDDAKAARRDADASVDTLPAASWLASAMAASAVNRPDASSSAAAATIADGDEAENPDASGQNQTGAFDEKTREKLMDAMSANEREDFLHATPARQDAYLRWKQHSQAVRQSAEEFAGFFFGFMMKEMRSTVQQGELGHGGKGEQVFQELLDEETGKNIAAGDRSGLVDILQKSLSGAAPYLGNRAGRPTGREAVYQQMAAEAAARSLGATNTTDVPPQSAERDVIC